MQQIKIDFDNPGLPQHLEAMEGDAQSRFFQATLYRSGVAYTPPAGVAYSIMYHGFGEQNQGWYDTIEDDTGKRDACVASGNVVTCEIDRHALIVPGHVSIVLCITNDRGYMLKSRPILTDARNDNYSDTVEVESYFRITGKTSAWWLQNKKDVQDLVDKATAEATKAKNSADASATSAAASKGSADDSAASASASAGSAAAAARSESAAAGSASSASGSASAAEESKTAAATSEANAAKHEEAAKKAADEAGAKAGTDKTLTIENAPADAAVVGRYILDRTKDTPELVFYSKAAVNELLAKKLGLHDTANNSTKWNNMELRLNHNTTDTRVAVFSENHVDYVQEQEIADLNGVAASGSNYVRFSDGTQICTTQLSVQNIAQGGTYEVNSVAFPVPFSAVPTMSTGSSWGWGEDAFFTGLSNANFSIRILNCSSNSHSRHVIAIGRWK